MSARKRQHIDAPLHVRGESEYVDDQIPPGGMLQAAAFGSPVAHGRIRGIDTSEARRAPGVRAVLTADDVPGTNRIGPIIPDEPILAEGKVHYQGQPVALVVADTRDNARHAASLVRLDVEELRPVTDPREAFEAGDVIGEPRTFELGEPDEVWEACAHVLSDRVELGGQEHLYLETNRARAVPEEGQRVTVHSSSQSPAAVQKAVATILGVPRHQVEIDVKRLGGGFGGKEDQATHWACLAGLAAKHVKRPVELVLHRIDDMKMTGKRHPYSADFRIGVDAEGRILAFETSLYQDAGAAADLSPAVLGRSLFHATNAYRVPHARIFAASCRTNVPPNTAFRGFGGPQGMFVIECALAKVAEHLKLRREEVQSRNLLEEGDVFPYGQRAEDVRARMTWDELDQRHDLAALREAVDAYNAQHEATKRGLAVMPICFGISFTKSVLNQASSLVHVYVDGSVSVSTGGIEMGQGVSTNLHDLAADAFGIADERVRVETTNTRRVANMSPSAASATTDLNGNATLRAVGHILRRLKGLAARKLGVDDPERIAIQRERVLYRGSDTGMSWEELVTAAYVERLSLSEHAFYATPKIAFDREREKGRPFAYHVYGTAAVQVTVDCLRGRYDIDSVRLVHDLGRSINHLVDLGQVEGALAQGLGWMTLEELSYGSDGRLLSGALSTYKAPDAYFMPDDLQVTMLENENPPGPRGSKAVGEPPFMYGIGAYFAIREAVRAFVGDRDLAFDAPATPEKVLLDLHGAALAEGASRPETSSGVGEVEQPAAAAAAGAGASPPVRASGEPVRASGEPVRASGEGGGVPHS